MQLKDLFKDNFNTLSVYLNVLQKRFVFRPIKFDIMVIPRVISAHCELGIGLFKKLKIGQSKLFNANII